MEKSKIKAIIFDVGGVLALGKNSIEISNKNSSNRGIHEYIAKKLKISLDQWIDSIDTTYAGAIEGKISRSKAISIISKNVKTTPEKLEKIILKSYKKNFKHNNKLYRLAFRLKRKGYKIGILSDQWYLSKEALIPTRKIKKFDSVIISCDVGLRKPDIKIYKLLIKNIKLKPEEILFIDNQGWNIEPAKKLGIKTILYKDNKQLIGELKKNAIVIPGIF